MEKEVKVKEKIVKKQEFLGIKSKNETLLVGKKGGNTTPSSTWRIGLTQSEASRLTFPSSFTTTISARKLGANLWEVQPHLEMSKGGVPPPSRSQHHKTKSKDCDCELPNQFDPTPVTDNPPKQPTTTSDLWKHSLLPMMQHRRSVKRNDHALPPVSPGSSNSMEMSPYRHAISPNGSPHLKGRARDSNNNLKTSTELVKLLNRIWSLEEQHASNISLVKAMKTELDHARSQVRDLLQERKMLHREMDDMMRQDKVVRKHKEDGQVKDVIQSMKNEVEDERKLRKHSESLNRKLAREHSDVKSSFSNALKELERERKARILLEDLCDEFAKGIRDYEREIRLRKSSFEKDWTTQDRLILHISEAWLNERMQMKLAENHSGFTDEKTIMDKLSSEIEMLLRTKKFVSSVNDGMLSSKLRTGSNMSGCSLESFHLNEPRSAPLNGNDEEDYVDSDLCFSELKRDSSPKHSNASMMQQSENGPKDRVVKKNAKSNLMKKFQSQEDIKGSDLLNLEMQHKQQRLGDVALNGNESMLENMEPANTKGRSPAHSRVLHNTEVAEVLGKADDYLLQNRIRDPSSSEGKHHHEFNHAENGSDPLSFSGASSPVERWTSKALAPDLEASESSSRWHQGVKENTLKAKLLEARLESQQKSSSRASKVA